MTGEEYEEEDVAESFWIEWDNPKITSQIQSYAGMCLFSPVQGSLVVLCTTDDGWEWYDITECKRKFQPTVVKDKK